MLPVRGLPERSALRSHEALSRATGRLVVEATRRASEALRRLPGTELHRLELLALDEPERRLRHLPPAAVDGERVSAPRYLRDLGRRRGTSALLIRRVGQGARPRSRRPVRRLTRRRADPIARPGQCRPESPEASGPRSSCPPALHTKRTGEDACATW